MALLQTKVKSETSRTARSGSDRRVNNSRLTDATGAAFTAGRNALVWAVIMTVATLATEGKLQADEKTAAPRPGEEMRTPRRLVLCLDGTWNSAYDEHKRRDGHTVLKPTNVLKACRAVLPIDDAGAMQIAYYDIGVGSLAEYPGAANRLLYFSYYLPR